MDNNITTDGHQKIVRVVCTTLLFIFFIKRERKKDMQSSNGFIDKKNPITLHTTKNDLIFFSSSIKYSHN